eukprot:1033847_1
MTQLISTMPCNGVKTVHTNGDIWHDPAGVCVSYHQDETSPTSEILLCQDGVMMHKSFTTSHCMGSPDEVLAYCEEMIEPENDIESCESNCAASGCTYLHVTYYSKTTGCNSWDGSGTPSALSTSTEFETVSGNDYPTIILNWCLSNSTMISNGTAILNLTYATADCSGDPVQSEVEFHLGYICQSDIIYYPISVISAWKYEALTASNTYDTIIPTARQIAHDSIPTAYAPTAQPNTMITNSLFITAATTGVNQGNHGDELLTALIAIICFGVILIAFAYILCIRGKTALETHDEIMEEPGSPQVNSDDTKPQLLAILSDWRLSQYYTILVETQGYDQVDDWMDISVEQLENDMNFKPGHAQRFVKKTKQYFKQKENEAMDEIIQKKHSEGLTVLAVKEGNAEVEIALTRKYSSDEEDEKLYDPPQTTTGGEITTGGKLTTNILRIKTARVII